MESRSWQYFLMIILDFLAPRSCVFCGEPGAAGEQSICTGCFADLPWNESPVSSTPGIFEASIAMLHYSFPIDVAIKALKFRRKLYYAPALAEVLCVARPLLPPGIDAVLPVPLHWRRKAMRGFNQATELARPIAKLLGVPLARNVRRKRATPFQSGLDAAERAKNLRSAFVITRPELCTHVLIIDDVVTTGATARALAKQLLSSGVTKVSVLAVARAR
jgi:ComF family protein